MSTMRLSRMIVLFGLLLSALTSVAVNASPVIEQWQTSKGSKVLFVEAPELPMVDIKIVFDAGSARDGDDFGIAQFTNGMLEEGAGTLDVEQIARGFEDLGARFSSGAARDMATLSLRSLTQKGLLEPALELFATVAGKATFPSNAVERVRAQMLVSIVNQEQKPGTIASKAFAASLMANTPTGVPMAEPKRALRRSPVRH